MQITIFNSKTKQKESLNTIDKDHLKLYVCGPTVYQRPHLGNARSIVVYDLWYRLFKKAFKKVTYVRNITDIDDKIIKAAKNQNIAISQLTNQVIKEFNHDIGALNNLKPDFEPKATKHIAQIIAMIKRLIENDYAYVSDGHVLFNVKKYQNYGSLSNRSLDEMISGARIEVAEYKKDPLDFVLWKPASSDDDDSAKFNSPWSLGRPGWHIECSAMSTKILGENFDIHGGGADLTFPHHENEIAQSVCANPNSSFAKYWIHNGFLTVNGEKMSKSLNNFITVQDLLENEDIPWVAIRYFLISTHYRKPIDYNLKALGDAKNSILKFHKVISEKIDQNIIDQNQNNSDLDDA